jgi:glycerol uptake facilitator protein
MGTRISSLPIRCLAEVLGTYILIFFGCGAVHAFVLADAQSGLWQVAIVWGVAIMLAAYVCGAISGAHINPAITVALAVWGRFSWRGVLPYILSQLAGAFLAAATLFVLYQPFLDDKEAKARVIRGGPGSEITAKCYGEYFPRISEPVAFGAETLGTLFLALAVFAMTDPRNTGGPPNNMAPMFVGLTVAILISVIAPLTQACFNPARDFGPRLFAYLAGWGAIAIPGPGSRTGFLTVYIVAPVLGAVLGGGLYNLVLLPALPVEVEEQAVP